MLQEHDSQDGEREQRDGPVGTGSFQEACHTWHPARWLGPDPIMVLVRVNAKYGDQPCCGGNRPNPVGRPAWAGARAKVVIYEVDARAGEKVRNAEADQLVVDGDEKSDKRQQKEEP